VKALIETDGEKMFSLEDESRVLSKHCECLC
jgi:hypothetical protein